jgi:hypothetical protein
MVQSYNIYIYIICVHIGFILGKARPEGVQNFKGGRVGDKHLILLHFKKPPPGPPPKKKVE